MDSKFDEESLIDSDTQNESSDTGNPDIFSIPRVESCLTVYKIDCKHCHHLLPTNMQDRKRLIIAAVICSVFMVVEVVGGIWSNSLVIVTDAAHLLTDISAFSASLFAMWLSTRPPTLNLNFGYYRAEVLAALFSILTIWLLTGILVYIAIRRISAMDFEIDATIMVLVAALGIVVNLAMGMVLHCNYGFGPISNMNIRAAFIHVVGDLLQSCAVMIAALIIYFAPKYKISDPICTLIFSILVLCTTIKILKDVIQILMEGVPKGFDLMRIRELLLSLPNVVGVFNLRVWALTNEHIALSAHVVVDQKANFSKVLKMAIDTIKENFKIFELTLQIEEFDGDPSKRCLTCVKEQENVA